MYLKRTPEHFADVSRAALPAGGAGRRLGKKNHRQSRKNIDGIKSEIWKARRLSRQRLARVIEKRGQGLATVAGVVIR
jgi:hypothetical protein